MGWQEESTLVSDAVTAPVQAVPEWQKNSTMVQEAVSNEPRPAVGLVEHVRAGFQASAPGLAWRGKLPDLVMSPEHSKWWERLATGVTQVASELPIMIPAGAVGTTAGTTMAGPPGGILLGGAAMFGVPAAIRESLIQAYKSGEVMTVADWFNAVREVAIKTTEEAALGAATMGTGALARGGLAVAMGAGKEAATAVGLGTATMASRGAARATGAADVAGQIATMVSIPAGLEGRLPDLHEFGDAAAVILTLKGGHVAYSKAMEYRTAQRMAEVYAKTGKTPAEQVQDAQSDPKVAADLVEPRPEVSPTTGTTSGVPVKLDRLIAEAEFLARGGVPEAPNIRNLIREIKETGPLQGDLLKDVDRLDTLARKVERTNDLTVDERTELNDLRARLSTRGVAPHEESGRRVYDDVLRQIADLEESRRAAGLKPIYDRPPEAIARLVQRQVSTMASMHGITPEEIYRERFPTFRDATHAEAQAAEAAIPPEAVRFTPPETDIFGEPVPTTVPRLGVEGMETVEVPLEKLVLSKEVPQFKAAADERGVIVPLGGKFDRTGVGPVQVWERKDGTMEVISGRHRLDLARRSGETTIPAQVHKESEGFTAARAAALDAELNIREEQGSVADYVQHFKASGLTKETADELGLLARAKGRAGFAIARDGADDLRAAHRAGLLSDEAALSISQAAPGNERMQSLGISMVNEGKSTLIAVNTMKALGVKAAERIAGGAQGDIFGFDDSAMREASAMAKRATGEQRRLGEQIAAVSGASKRPELAKKMGVDVQDPEGIQKKIVELRQEQSLWDNWPLHPELVARLREPEVTGREGDLKQGAVKAPVLQRNEFGHPEIVAQDVMLGKTAKWETRDGVDYMEHLIIDPKTGQPAGKVTLGWKGDKVDQLLFVAVPAELRTKGLGEAVVRAILEHNGPENPVFVSTILHQARGFWKKMGTEINKDADGTISLEAYRAARPGRAGEERGGEAAAGASGGGGEEASGAARETPRVDLKQDEFSLVPETPAELAARNEEAAAQARRKLADEAAGRKSGAALTPQERKAQADLFNTQKELFQPAYHGSPHKFDKFSLHAIGTGEGAQVYGYGLYFTSKKEIAEWYRNKLSGPGIHRELIINGIPEKDIYNGAYPLRGELTEGDLNLAMQHIVYYIRLYRDPKKGLEEARNIANTLGDSRPETGAAKRLFEAAKVEVTEDRIPGQLYKVEIPDDHVLLNTEKSISDQSPEVKTALIAAIKYAAETRAQADADKFDHPYMPEAAVPRILRENGIADINDLKITGREAYSKIERLLYGPQSASEALAREGILGLSYEGRTSGEKNYVIFDDKAAQITETYYQEHRAAYNVADRLITTFETADRSSILHELGHHFLEDLKHYAAKPNAPERVKAMWEMARKEFAIPETGEIGKASHEQMARSWERYLGEGEAPTPAMKAMFDQFKAWMLAVYNDLKNLVGVRINPEVKDLFDRMLATDEELAAARDLNVPRAYVEVAKENEARKIVPGFKAEQISMDPYADELPKGPGEAPNNSHVNYDTVDSPTKIKLTLQRLAEIDQENVQKSRGGKSGVETWQQEQATMEKWILDTLGGGEDRMKLLGGANPNDPKTNHRLRAMKQMMVGAGHESERLRDVILEKGHNATIEEQMQYLSSIELLRQLHAEFLGERAAVARAMNALKDTTEGSAAVSSMLEAIGRGADSNTLFQSAAEKAAADQAMLKVKLDEIMLQYGGKTVLDIARLHKEIGTLKGTFKMSKDLEKATTWQMVVEGWKAGLLSGPQTPVTNVLGTWSFQALRAPVDAVASIIGMARGASPGMGESDRASMSEALARITGPLGGMQDALKLAYHALKVEDLTGKTETYQAAIPGVAGDVIRFPFRLMSAGDVLTTTMYKRGEMKTLAIRKAFDEELNPATREFGERVNYLMDHPTPEMQVEADRASTRMAFNDPGGEKTRALQLFVNKWNLQWAIPFIRTPINITEEMIRMTPFAPLAGAWRADIAKGGVARDKAIAEVVVGSGIMALTMAYAFSGQITGSGSPDPGKNRGKVGVWQPNSVLIGDTYYEIGRLQPGGTLMILAADVANVWDHMTEEERDKIPKMLAIAFRNAITNQTFLQGVTSVVNALSEPERFFPKFGQQMAGSLVPNIIGQPTAMADPVVRQVNSMVEAVQARIPFAREQLIPERDWLGEPVATKERLGVVLPVREQKISNDKVRLEAARLDISMAAAPKKTHIGKGTGKLGDVEFTPEERDTFARVGGEMAHRILGTIVNGPGYDQMPDLVKRKVFAKVLAASHQVAAVQALPMDKRIAYMQSISEKVAQELSPAESQ